MSFYLIAFIPHTHAGIHTHTQPTTVYNLAFQLWAATCTCANVLHIGFRSWHVQLRRCVRVSQKRAAFTFKGTRPFFMELVLSKIKATGPFATSGTTTHRRRWHPRRQKPRLFSAVHCLRHIYTRYVPETHYSHVHGINADRCLTIFIFKLVTAVGIDLVTHNMPTLVQRSIGMATNLLKTGMVQEMNNLSSCQLLIGAKQGTGSLSCAS